MIFYRRLFVLLVCLILTLSALALVAECRRLRSNVTSFRTAEVEEGNQDDEEDEKPCKDKACPWPYDCIVEEGDEKEPTCVCPENCPNKLELVCTTKKRQFLNECELKRSACRRGNKSIRPYFKGNCRKLESYLFWKKDCKDECSPERSIKVCGTNGKTYKHPCKLVKAICKSKPGETIMLAHGGPCEEDEKNKDEKEEEKDETGKDDKKKDKKKDDKKDDKKKKDN